mgnify:CR=1 FL=1|jgi:hypothetical protein
MIPNIDKKLTRFEEKIVKLIKKTNKIHGITLTNRVFFNILNR